MQDQNTAQVVPFDYGSVAVRTVIIDSEPWFILADLCKVLGIGNAADVRKRLDEAGVDSIDISSGGQRRAVTIVNEPNMYEVVIRSDKPEAVAFRRWITGTVLPEIRKTGSFNAQPAINGGDITRLELIEIARNAEMERLALEAKNAELEPKADAYDNFIDATGKYVIPGGIDAHTGAQPGEKITIVVEHAQGKVDRYTMSKEADSEGKATFGVQAKVKRVK